MARLIAATFFSLILTSKLFSQTPLTLDQCEAMFQQKNLLLLAEQYNIGIAEARVIQAKIWERPYLEAEFNAANPEYNRVFDAGRNGQKAIAIQQLIYLGGKKKNEVAFAKSEVSVAALDFEQLVQALRFQIRQSFYSIHYEQVKVRTMQSQLLNIDSLAAAYLVQAEKGNIPLKDVVRLQSLSLTIKNDLNTVYKNIFNEQEKLKVLINITDDIKPVVSDGFSNRNYTKAVEQSVEQLQQTALEKNPVYLVTLRITASNDLYLKWQRSLSIPDLTLGAAYDQTGGAFKNQVNLTVGVPLNFWNINKGNIKAAEQQKDQSKKLQEQKILELNAGIANAYQSLRYQQKQYEQINSGAPQYLETVYMGILQNFQKRNISLIEFTDFMESYNQNTVLLNNMKKELIISAETLNYLVNEQLF